MKKFYLLTALAVCAMMVFSCKNDGKGKKEIKDAAKDAVEAVEDAAQDAAKEAADVISDAVEEAGDAAAKAAERAKLELEKLGDIQPYSAVEVKPTFNEGDANSFVKYVQSNIKYPEKALENDIEGKVTVNFVVDAAGKIRNAKVVKGVDPELDAEALRVVSEAPAWAPAKQNGKNVPVTCSIPVTFKIVK
ncbi:protein TonB [Bacteroidales bacterium WCE2004]|jgi:protein TonB|nr:energy transducer TonB [Bacteroidales bacterium]SKC47384.1 protein TonB [Bacteroidales bacterium WCE2004]